MDEHRRHTYEIGWRLLAVVVLVALLALVTACGIKAPWTVPEEEPEARAIQTKIQMVNGGDKLQAVSGGEFEVQSGGIIDIQAGATFNIGGDIDIEGAMDVGGTLKANALVITTTGDFGGDVILQNDESIGNQTNGTVAITATTVSVIGQLDAATEDILLENEESIGNQTNGTVAITATTVSANGNLQTTGSLDVQGGNITLQNDETIANSSNGVITLTATTVGFSDAGYVNKTLTVDGLVTANSGAVIIGTLDASTEDFVLENDESIGNQTNGTVYVTATQTTVSGAFTANGLLTANTEDIALENGELIGNQVNGTVAVTPTAAGSFYVATGNLKVGDANPSVAMDGEDGFVEGTMEVGGATTLSNTLATYGLLTANAGATIVGTLDASTEDLVLENDESIGNQTNGTVYITATQTTVSGAFTANGLLTANTEDIALENGELIGNQVNGTVAVTPTAAGSFYVATGNLKVGDANPSVAMDGEDGFVEGTMEVGGATTLSNTLATYGLLTANAGATIVGTLDASTEDFVLENDESIGNQTNGTVYVTATQTTVSGAFTANGLLTANTEDIALENGELIGNQVNGTVAVTPTAAGSFYVATGNLKVGDANPSVAMDGEDGFVEGTMEVGGATTLSNTLATYGLLTANAGATIVGTLDASTEDFVLENDESIGNQTNGTVYVTATQTTVSGAFTANGLLTANTEDIALENGELIGNQVNGTVAVTPTAAGSFYVATGNLKVGDANPSVAMDGEDGFVEGTMEVGGATTLSNTLATYGLLTANAGATIVGTLDASTEDFVLENDESIGNQTNGTVAITATTTSVSGAFIVATWGNYAVQSTCTITTGQSITPTGTYQPIASTDGTAITTSTSIAIVNGSRTGDILILENLNASGDITLDGTGGNVECKADIVIGHHDTVTLMWNGADWICLDAYDNS